MDFVGEEVGRGVDGETVGNVELDGTEELDIVGRPEADGEDESDMVGGVLDIVVGGMVGLRVTGDTVGEADGLGDGSS